MYTFPVLRCCKPWDSLTVMLLCRDTFWTWSKRADGLDWVQKANSCQPVTYFTSLILDFAAALLTVAQLAATALESEYPIESGFWIEALGCFLEIRCEDEKAEQEKVKQEKAEREKAGQEAVKQNTKDWNE